MLTPLAKVSSIMPHPHPESSPSGARYPLPLAISALRATSLKSNPSIRCHRTNVVQLGIFLPFCVSKQAVHSYRPSPPGVPSPVAWSPNSQFVLVVLDGRGQAMVYSVADPAWSFLIDEVSAGIMDAVWTLDSNFIVTCADFRVRLSVFSIPDQKCIVHIASPKCTCEGLALHPDGSLLAVPHRKQGQDMSKCGDSRERGEVAGPNRISPDPPDPPIPYFSVSFSRPVRGGHV